MKIVSFDGHESLYDSCFMDLNVMLQFKKEDADKKSEDSKAPLLQAADLALALYSVIDLLGRHHVIDPFET